ncbi:MBL fold metallo-hydrolase [Corynebacterium aquatimens]|uniref:Ribonuclease BN (tRNA processing enzyme) n=1 Tax=Corynebacterium aquatimens TaxID=1190508 RepID=A0A931GXR2_9CORY|nr:MBL fold metallo-hydrolase [Corynebacterium aquatimens]MBG6122234.1 ribonuclease BN (tRNA processing enzyme) [Corynebacterium aquatimens]WJY65225.1 Ribonuclease Z [Corynebacterium aquatimens]
MKLTILGCTGSLSSPGNPGSSYLITQDTGDEPAGTTPGILMDFGPGALAALQEVGDPSNAHLLFSHLHADHCSDSASLIVWRRYHPHVPAQRRHAMWGPSYAAEHIGRLGSDGPDDVNDITDTFEVGVWQPGVPVDVEGLRVTPYPVVHPAQESHALRVEDPRTGTTITYSGDTGWTEELIRAARGADLFLCEAAWGPSAEGMPEGMHLSGAQAGRIAREAAVDKLVLVHIQPWSDADATLAAARAEFDGEIVVGKAKDVFIL